MTLNTQTSSGLSNSKSAPVDRVKQLAARLLSERGETSGAQVARELHHVLRALDADDRHSFQRYLATEFQPDKGALRTAAERYLADTTAGAAAAHERGARQHRRADRDAQRTHRASARRAGVKAARRRPQASLRLLVQPRLSRAAADRLAVPGGGAGEADRL